MELDTLFRDVASVLSEKCINPESNRPYTLSMLERALRDVHFSVDPKRPAKAQALEVGCQAPPPALQGAAGAAKRCAGVAGRGGCRAWWRVRRGVGTGSRGGTEPVRRLAGMPHAPPPLLSRRVAPVRRDCPWRRRCRC